MATPHLSQKHYMIVAQLLFGPPKNQTSSGFTQSQLFLSDYTSRVRIIMLKMDICWGVGMAVLSNQEKYCWVKFSLDHTPTCECLEKN